MKAFIKYEEEEEYWYFKPSSRLDFSILKSLDYCSFFNKKTEISVQLESSEELKEPSKKQIETLDFILENQEEILISIFNFNQRFIYPIYNESIDIEENEIVNSASELSRVYGIKHLEIPNIKTSGAFYFLIRFDFRYDDEHGLYLLFKDNSVIDFFGEGDKNYDVISVYENGLKKNNETALEIKLYKIHFKSILKHHCQFKEKIEFPLKKGAYRVSIQSNGKQYVINFHSSIDLENFSLEQTLFMK
jgi:hypothetical protein